MAEANAILAPTAVPHQGTLGRIYPEPEDETRFPFQRDRDRIIHSQAFRRLKGKTQVFVAGKGDHYRTRLTHTMEVAQISRDMARTLSLNEDLAECIALAHDLGHPPFGHAGESALDEWMRAHDGSFEHNEQSLRVVTLLEEHSSLYPGLNLNREVLEGLQKHGPKPLGREAELVNLADEIAYTGHDCEDGLRAELFTQEQLDGVRLARMATDRARERGTSLRGSLIHLLVTDAYDHDGFPSKDMKVQLKELRGFLWTHMYEHPRVLEASTDGKASVIALCEKFFSDPSDKVLALQKRTGSSLPEGVKDYVAGMTDAYAKTILTPDTSADI